MTYFPRLIKEAIIGCYIHMHQCHSCKPNCFLLCKQLYSIYMLKWSIHTVSCGRNCNCYVSESASNFNILTLKHNCLAGCKPFYLQELHVHVSVSIIPGCALYMITMQQCLLTEAFGNTGWLSQWMGWILLLNKWIVNEVVGSLQSIPQIPLACHQPGCQHRALPVAVPWHQSSTVTPQQSDLHDSALWGQPPSNILFFVLPTKTSM